ncbi:hypothetical protein GCM10007913_15660 [Devosia yakushimensis]|uniref:Uncharacterized protein n=1 Tax=Devosia yakushimensis TaxID=470028 RepID=A0ABQ5UC21_9HYPH|nr:hypothetical protein GCM10007913_15660 [Devosia yakushimensis]
MAAFLDARCDKEKGGPEKISRGAASPAAANGFPVAAKSAGPFLGLDPRTIPRLCRIESGPRVEPEGEQVVWRGRDANLA